jgi:endo-1,4-beta-xylanase
MTADGTTGCSWSRRTFLKAAGMGIGTLAAVPWGRSEERKEDVVGQADDRILRHRTGTVVVSLVGPDGQAFPPGVQMKVSQTGHKFLFGCNIFKLGSCRTSDDNAAYEKHFAELLNYATLPFYWWTYESRKGQPIDEHTDEIVRWCKAHDVATKGHPLAWNYIDPRWLTGTPEEVLDLQLQRVGWCVERFKGNIDIWDVVNEATHYDRDELKKQAPKLTEAIAKVGVGEYVRRAFAAARKANSQATLLINDYRVDRDYEDKVLAVLVDAERRPLYDVIGIQSHMHGGYWGAARTWAVCERFAKFGKPLHFTETTVVSGPRKDSAWATTPEGEEQQAKAVAEFYTVLFSHPAVTGITWWDFTDQNAWQRAPAGLVRDDMTPKPAYDRLHDLIKGKWWTQTEVETGLNGRASIQGFYGQYTVDASLGGRHLTGRFSLDASTATPLDVRMTEKG